MNLLKEMFFIELFMIILEGYFEYLITSFLAWTDNGDTEAGGKFFMVLILIMCLVVAPLAFFY